MMVGLAFEKLLSPENGCSGIFGKAPKTLPSIKAVQFFLQNTKFVCV